jgi:alkylation response protein AidB-like acyl-CoA dehydrogenase
MSFDLLHSWDASSFSFKIAVLAAIALAYVAFELVLLALEANRKRRSVPRLERGGLAEFGVGELAAAANLARLGVEAYRPVSSWTSAPKHD